MDKISILGCGWFGLAFGKQMASKGFRVNGSTTSQAKLPILAEAGIEPFLIDILHPDTYSSNPLFFDCHILVITVPHSKHKDEADDYCSKISLLIQTVTTHHIKKLVLISSTGVYDKNVGVVDENIQPLAESPSAKIMLRVEELFMQETAFKATVVRFAGLVGPGRHPGRFLAGKRDVENGQAAVNLIHLDDAIGVCSTLIEQNFFGHIINACCPDHPFRQDFYTLAAINGGYTPPVFKPGGEHSKRVTSIVIPNLLAYEFAIDNWLSWLNGQSE